MQTGANPHLDANAAHSPEIREDDPRHLGNLTKRMSAMNSQVSADTKYDTHPPPRVDSTGAIVKEPFVSPIDDSDDQIFTEQMYLIVGVCLIIIVLGLLIVVDPRLRKIAQSSSYGLLAVIFICTVALITIGIIKYTLDKNETDKWYPMSQYTS
jgi:hypothetical protein